MLLSNLFFCFLLVGSYFFSDYYIAQILGFASLFALSGGITNWIAVYMLFEKIPFVIGSGVIPNHFEGFKKSIRSIILDNFFQKKNFQTIQDDAIKTDWKKEVLDKISTPNLFDSIIKDFTNSSNAGMLNMLGGTSFLESFRYPFEKSAKNKIEQILQNINLKEVFFQKNNYQTFLQKVTKILDQELEKLTPQKIKQIVANIIKKHLSWLVVWGSFFGFFLGIISSIFYKF